MAVHANSMAQCVFALGPRPPVQADNSLLANDSIWESLRKEHKVQVLHNSMAVPEPLRAPQEPCSIC